MTALMTSDIPAAMRGVPVAALDLNPGATSLAARRASALSIWGLLAGQEPGQQVGRGTRARLDVIADPPCAREAHTLKGDGYQRLADLLAERYPSAMIDPPPSGLTPVLSEADQPVLVAPASPDTATLLPNTRHWRGGHGYGELADRAVNGVSRQTTQDVLRAGSAGRGRCRAIVRVPWDDLLSARPNASSTLDDRGRRQVDAVFITLDRATRHCTPMMTVRSKISSPVELKDVLLLVKESLVNTKMVAT